MLVLHYAISLACAWLLIYLAGLLQKRADIAYWDLLISFTIAYALIAAIIAVGKPPRPQGARARGIGAGIKRPITARQCCNGAVLAHARGGRPGMRTGRAAASSSNEASSQPMSSPSRLTVMPGQSMRRRLQRLRWTNGVWAYQPGT